MSRESMQFDDVILSFCAHCRSTTTSLALIRLSRQQSEPPIACVSGQKEESSSSLSTSAPKAAENDDASGAIGTGRPPSARVQRLLSRLTHFPRRDRSLREGDGEQLLPGQELGETVRQHDPSYQRCRNFFYWSSHTYKRGGLVELRAWW